MENLNHALFLWLNAPEHPRTLLLAVATIFAEYASSGSVERSSNCLPKTHPNWMGTQVMGLWMA